MYQTMYDTEDNGTYNKEELMSNSNILALLNPWSGWQIMGKQMCLHNNYLLLML